MNTTADVRADGVTLYTPTQAQTDSQKTAAKITGLPLESLEKALEERFGKKKPEVVQSNIEAARAGFEHAKQNWKSLGLGLELSKKQRLVMTRRQIWKQLDEAF